MQEEFVLKLRISIAPLEISGIYRQLQIGLNSLGHRVTFYNLFPDGYPDVENIASTTSTDFLLRNINRSVKQSRSSNLPFLVFVFKLKFLIQSLLLFLESLFHTDVYIFSWGMSFLPKNIDLLILKIMRKKTICIVGHGSELRPPYVGNNGLKDSVSEIPDELLYGIYKETKKVARKACRIERWAGTVVGLPTTSHFLFKPYVNFYQLGIPCNPYMENIKSINPFQKSIVILHAPSKPDIKGSELIREAIKELQIEFQNVEFLELTGVSNEEVLCAMKNADLVIDQAWSDIPMATVGVEAASLGVPSVTFGNAQDYWVAYAEEVGFPIEGYLPTKELLATLRKLVSDNIYLNHLGKRQQDFVVKFWNREAVAENYIKLISGTAPSAWGVAPHGKIYLDGAGVSKRVAHLQTMSLHVQFGFHSLQLREDCANQVKQLSDFSCKEGPTCNQ